MLRRMKIGTRVNLLIAVPLVALVVLMGVSYVSLQRASVRGTEYKQLKAAQDLRSDIVPPPVNLLEAWTDVNHISVLVSAPVSIPTNKEIVVWRTKLADAREHFKTAVAYWQSQPMDRETKNAFNDAAQYGTAFFDAVDTKFTPALAERDPALVIAAVRSLEDPFNVEQVFATKLLGLVNKQVDAKERSTDQYVNTVLIILSLAVGGLLIIGVMVSFMVRRSIVRPILALSSQAKKVATNDLPDAVHKMQSMAADGTKPTILPFRMDTHDELADLSASFNSVQNAALDLAAEQAMARRIVSENLVNIARRTQTLLGRSLTSLSDMEQGERDPETLENLFRLDHLATRMRRNAQSLLVLAGAEQNRLWSAPVPVGDVVRAAVSEIENYNRVDLGDLGSANVQGALAPDIAHLLAELLENAATFSPPSTRVMVVGRSFSDGHQIAIVDYGIGMSDVELRDANDTLRRQADFDKASSRMLGFQVVSRLAARHRIQVLLAQTAGATGVTAIVKLPMTVLETRSAPQTQPQSASGPLPQRVPMAPPAAPPIAQPRPIAATSGLEAAPDNATSPTAPVVMAAVPPPPVITAPPTLVPAPIPVPVPESASAMATVATAPTMPERHTVTDAELWELVGEPTSAPSAAPTVEPPRQDEPSAPPALVKRVRGAQMPNLGAATSDDPSGYERPPEQVRNTLASLQRGIDLGRQAANDSPPAN